MKLLIGAILILALVLNAAGAQGPSTPSMQFHADEVKGQVQIIKGTSNTISQVDISDDSGIGLTQNDVMFNGAGDAPLNAIVNDNEAGLIGSVAYDNGGDFTAKATFSELTQSTGLGSIIAKAYTGVDVTGEGYLDNLNAYAQKGCMGGPMATQIGYVDPNDEGIYDTATYFTGAAINQRTLNGVVPIYGAEVSTQVTASAAGSPGLQTFQGSSASGNDLTMASAFQSSSAYAEKGDTATVEAQSYDPTGQTDTKATVISGYNPGLIGNVFDGGYNGINQGAVAGENDGSAIGGWLPAGIKGSDVAGFYTTGSVNIGDNFGDFTVDPGAPLLSGDAVDVSAHTWAYDYPNVDQYGNPLPSSNDGYQVTPEYLLNGKIRYDSDNKPIRDDGGNIIIDNAVAESYSYAYHGTYDGTNYGAGAFVAPVPGIHYDSGSFVPDPDWGHVVT